MAAACQRSVGLASAKSAPTVRKLALVVAVVAVATKLLAEDRCVDDVPDVALGWTAVEALLWVAACESAGPVVSIVVAMTASAAMPLRRMERVGRVGMVWFFEATGWRWEHFTFRSRLLLFDVTSMCIDAKQRFHVMVLSRR